jgi:flagellar biogenesis protein FliO
MKYESIKKLLGSAVIAVVSFIELIYTELCNIICGALFFIALVFFLGIYWVITKIENLKFKKKKSSSHGFYCIT